MTVCRCLTLSALVLLGVGVAGAQELGDPEVSNWPAPATWTTKTTAQGANVD